MSNPKCSVKCCNNERMFKGDARGVCIDHAGQKPDVKEVLKEMKSLSMLQNNDFYSSNRSHYWRPTLFW